MIFSKISNNYVCNFKKLKSDKKQVFADIVCFDLISPLIPDQPQVKRLPPLLQITLNFLVFYGLSHGITFEKNGVAQNLKYSKL